MVKFFGKSFEELNAELIQNSNNSWDTLAVLCVLFQIQDADNHNFDSIVQGKGSELVLHQWNKIKRTPWENCTRYIIDGLSNMTKMSVQWQEIWSRLVLESNVACNIFIQWRKLVVVKETWAYFYKTCKRLLICITSKEVQWLKKWLRVLKGFEKAWAYFWQHVRAY